MAVHDTVVVPRAKVVPAKAIFLLLLFGAIIPAAIGGAYLLLTRNRANRRNSPPPPPPGEGWPEGPNASPQWSDEGG